MIDRGCCFCWNLSYEVLFFVFLLYRLFNAQYTVVSLASFKISSPERFSRSHSLLDTMVNQKSAQTPLDTLMTNRSRLPTTHNNIHSHLQNNARPATPIHPTPQTRRTDTHRRGNSLGNTRRHGRRRRQRG